MHTNTPNLVLVILKAPTFDGRTISTDQYCIFVHLGFSGFFSVILSCIVFSALFISVISFKSLIASVADNSDAG